MIVAGMDRAALERRLDEALLTPAEMGMGAEGWRNLHDPFQELFRDLAPAQQMVGA